MFMHGHDGDRAWADSVVVGVRVVIGMIPSPSLDALDIFTITANNIYYYHLLIN